MAIIEDFEDGIDGDPYLPGQFCFYSTDAHTGALALSLPAPYISPPSGAGFDASPDATEFGIWFKVPYVLHGGARVRLAADNEDFGLALLIRGEWWPGATSDPAPTDGRIALAERVDGFYEPDVADLGEIPWGQWLRFSVRPGVSWALKDAGGADLASGTTPVLPIASEGYGINVDCRAVDGELLVDDAFDITGPGPVVRLFPRDDGRGMSSAPRIWPPSASQRVIGGLQ